jgi:hypothetical protein
VPTGGTAQLDQLSFLPPTVYVDIVDVTIILVIPTLLWIITSLPNAALAMIRFLGK